MAGHKTGLGRECRVFHREIIGRESRVLAGQIVLPLFLYRRYAHSYIAHRTGEGDGQAGAMPFGGIKKNDIFHIS